MHHCRMSVTHFCILVDAYVAFVGKYPCTSTLNYMYIDKLREIRVGTASTDEYFFSKLKQYTRIFQFCPLIRFYKRLSISYLLTIIELMLLYWLGSQLIHPHAGKGFIYADSLRMCTCIAQVPIWKLPDGSICGRLSCLCVNLETLLISLIKGAFRGF